ncbi:hypothetical protein KFL_000020690 [Klebsormidium nitens]|uniref:Uncharacterized protein n=1 Tax=Klebsormidium nitens TaxID=105231 RepID=A0A1Y1HPG2_KLENI|nr:hypothetical protein KFL_000020690 [Klebsormidium nitens]|eukprot:GAQ77708.1 hypothetical protein KFL_000020690 [Klebsormidium nitens]
MEAFLWWQGILQVGRCDLGVLMSNSEAADGATNAEHSAKAHSTSNCTEPGCSHLHARIGSLENEIRTLHQTLQSFVNILPQLSHADQSAPREAHLSPVNLQSRFELEEGPEALGRGQGVDARRHDGTGVYQGGERQTEVLEEGRAENEVEAAERDRLEGDEDEGGASESEGAAGSDPADESRASSGNSLGSGPENEEQRGERTGRRAPGVEQSNADSAASRLEGEGDGAALSQGTGTKVKGRETEQGVEASSLALEGGERRKEVTGVSAANPEAGLSGGNESGGKIGEEQRAGDESETAEWQVDELEQGVLSIELSGGVPAARELLSEGLGAGQEYGPGNARETEQGEEGESSVATLGREGVSGIDIGGPGDAVAINGLAADVIAADEGVGPSAHTFIRKELSITVDEENGTAPNGRASLSSGGDSSGSQIEGHGTQDGASNSTSNSPLLTSPDARWGGIPRSNSISNFRPPRGGWRKHRRRSSSFGEGVLGRYPQESDPRGVVGSPGSSFELQPSSRENSWPEMGPEFYHSPQGGPQFVDPYQTYGSAPEVMYLPHQGFPMQGYLTSPGYVASPGYGNSPGYANSPGHSWSPGFAGSPVFPSSPAYPPSPGWGMELPQVANSVMGTPVPGPPPLDRTISEGALLAGSGNGGRGPAPEEKISRRASFGGRNTPTRSPGRGGRAGKKSPEHQKRGAAVAANPTPSEAIPPHARGLLGSSPQGVPDGPGSRPPSTLSSGRSSGSRGLQYMHACTSRSMQDLEAVWIENQQAYPRYQTGTSPGRPDENGPVTGIVQEKPLPENESSLGGTGYFMPTYPKPQRSRGKSPETPDKSTGG